MHSNVNICIHKPDAHSLHFQWGVIMSSMQLNPISVGRAISKARQEKGITQEVLSGLADIGRTHLSAIERGERKPTLETLWRIAFALDMSPNELVRKIEPTAARRSGGPQYQHQADF